MIIELTVDGKPVTRIVSETAVCNINSVECPDVVDPMVKFYRCNVCGKYSHWSPTHRHVEKPVGHGYSGYEVYFVTCSDTCREEARESFIKWLSKYEGWTKEKAASNYDNFVKGKTEIEDEE